MIKARGRHIREATLRNDSPHRDGRAKPQPTAGPVCPRTHWARPRRNRLEFRLGHVEHVVERDNGSVVVQLEHVQDLVEVERGGAGVSVNT